jgi:tetratricopeptide (TPR) repeat protein
MRNRITLISIAALLAAVLLTYSNHFGNGFHFDDSHTVVDNPYIRTLRNTPLFFTDSATFSNMPANRVYRPLVTLSLAVDYWLGNGLKPVLFQSSTFLWFLAQLVLMYLLFRRICDMARPDVQNRWVALLAAALYGLHPVMAETVNYVIQRGDLYSTLGLIAGILIYASSPRARKFGLYLLPVAAALLTKPSALIFPAILFVYICLFEDTGWRAALRRSIPALVLCGAGGALSWAMTPKTFAPGGLFSAWAYRLTQPLVALRFFRAFVIPDQLSADTDHVPVSGIFDQYAWLGFAFVIAAVMAAWWCSKRREWRPAAFGLWWFLLSLVPSAVFPLAEVENDHRMFLPFVGLVLTACWPIALWIYRQQYVSFRFRLAGAAACLAILAAYASGVRLRNEVWRNEETLWYDVTLKSPQNGRGLMNYGLTQMSKGEMQRALDYFNRALLWTPAYYSLEVNLGVAYGALNQDGPAEQHFVRATQLAPDQAVSHYFYARWLRQKGRPMEALRHLELAVAENPDYVSARYLLMQVASEQGGWGEVREAAAATLKRFPADSAALRYAAMAAGSHSEAPKSAADYLNLSLSRHMAGRYRESIQAAQQAIVLRPDFPEAYNNMAAAYEALQLWDQAIAAARQALKIRPGFQLAQNNLTWSEQQKSKAVQVQPVRHAALRAPGAGQIEQTLATR